MTIHSIPLANLPGGCAAHRCPTDPRALESQEPLRDNVLPRAPAAPAR
jgi:hypothetical protein